MQVELAFTFGYHTSIWNLCHITGIFAWLMVVVV